MSSGLAAQMLFTEFVMTLAVCQAHPHAGPESKPADFESFSGARSEVYKRTGEISLKMHVFYPTRHKPEDKRAAIVFFFGGAWRRGTPMQFVPQCRYLASRGMVAMTAEYRVHERHRARVTDCVADAQSAIRWVRASARRLGVDPNRIAAGGGSAGGHLAAATATLKDYTGAKQGEPISSRPNTLVLFNPAVNLTPDGFGYRLRRSSRLGLKDRLGADAKELSPLYHLKRGTPPTIIFHGKQDEAVPYAQVEAFAKAMKEAGNRCELVGFDGVGHGFFNYRRQDNRRFTETMRLTDRFLTSLSYLRGEPTIDDFAARTTSTRPK